MVTDDSIRELRELRDRHTELVDRLRAWTRTGGPIEASWALATQRLQRELHLAQCRAARRIFVSGQESSGPAAHCLGAFLVRREQVRRRGGSAVGVERAEYQRRHLEELRACRRVGGFQRFGDVDMAFVCDFCDGHLVWGDVERVPSAPTTHDSSPSPWPAPPVDGPSPPTSPTDNANTSTAYFGAAAAAAGGAAGVTHQQPQQLQQESWQATTYSMTRHREKQVVFAPLAIANHVPPHPGDWLARLTCPFCEDEAARPVDVDEDDEAWRPGDAVFEDLEALQEHLEWYHVPRAASGKGVADSCAVM